MSYSIMNNIDYKVGIYIRLSREDEEKEKYQESESIGNQRTLLMQYIKENKLYNDFEKFALSKGVNSTTLDGYNRYNFRSYINPMIIEERSLNGQRTGGKSFKEIFEFNLGHP